MPSAPKELNADLLRSLPDAGPVVMVNLVKYKVHSDDGNGSGQDAYERYCRAVVPPLLRGVGGMVLWSGRAEGAAFGDPDATYWDHVVLVWYPSRRADRFISHATRWHHASSRGVSRTQIAAGLP